MEVDKPIIITESKEVLYKLKKIIKYTCNDPDIEVAKNLFHQLKNQHEKMARDFKLIVRDL